ncbi:MAG: hypothetical protein K6A67_03660 [Bacteroidales bacterium]|nr:hypothetical protein [Bacteroidales bacterium]
MDAGQLQGSMGEIAFQTKGCDTVELGSFFAVFREVDNGCVVAEAVGLNNKVVMTFCIFENDADKTGLSGLGDDGINAECIDGATVTERNGVGGGETDVQGLLRRCPHPCLERVGGLHRERRGRKKCRHEETPLYI